MACILLQNADRVGSTKKRPSRPSRLPTPLNITGNLIEKILQHSATYFVAPLLTDQIIEKLLREIPNEILTKLKENRILQRTE
ncbi:hypothetical protein BpHYR1_031368 [Brachionus plicatilis]|uniref:Uncharacterized protein n=1 Tax=Brachionus plicatilis TaxID=10195 RepID=A0A3M7PLB1_BRAPC|nr:hypothetical protein BpHYR1_031368 [Brachionus plicatilis]